MISPPFTLTRKVENFKLIDFIHHTFVGKPCKDWTWPNMFVRIIEVQRIACHHFTSIFSSPTSLRRSAARFLRSSNCPRRSVFNEYMFRWRAWSSLEVFSWSLGRASKSLWAKHPPSRNKKRRERKDDPLFDKNFMEAKTAGAPSGERAPAEFPNVLISFLQIYRANSWSVSLLPCWEALVALPHYGRTIMTQKYQNLPFGSTTKLQSCAIWILRESLRF